MRLENIIVAFFVSVFFLTVVSIEPFSTGNFIMPTPIKLEVGLFVLALSFFVVIILLIPKRKYNAF